MLFKKIEDSVLACVFNRIDNRKTRGICHETNLDLEKGEKIYLKTED